MSKDTENSIDRIRRMEVDANKSLEDLAEERNHEVKVLVRFKSDFGLPEEPGVEYQIESTAKLVNENVYPEYIVSKSKDGSSFEEIGRAVDIIDAINAAKFTLENESAMALGR
jgi:hypothetical protein